MAGVSLFSQAWFLARDGARRTAIFSVPTLQLLIIYALALQALFRTAALTMTELALVLGLSAIVPCAVETEKAIKRQSAN